MKTVVFFLEEPSAEEMFKGLLPRVLSQDIDVRYITFQGKQDLEKNLCRKLRGWQLSETVFVVLRDQDSGDCHEVKAKLISLCVQAGRNDVLVRVACRELESFYLGDLKAVEQGLGINALATKQDTRKYRLPDLLGNPSEELNKLTAGVYQKRSGSRAIGPYLKLEGNRSHSFNVMLSGIQKLAEVV